MLADLLPQQFTDVLVTFSLSGGWGVASTIETDRTAGDLKFRVIEPENAIFFLARMLGRQSKSVGGVMIETLISGAWPFKVETVMKNRETKVLEKYLHLTGFKLRSRIAVMIAPMPVATGSVKWRAETRGSTVVLLIDPNTRSATGPANWNHFHA